MVRFLNLPPEVRRIVYRQLLVIDHNSNNWDWVLEAIGALNKRHALTRVSSQIRKEAQELFYTSIQWHIWVHYNNRHHVFIEDKVLQILQTLGDWDQLGHIRNVKITFVIKDPHHLRHITLEQVAALTLHSPRNFATLKLFQMFVGLQHLEMSWLDSARTLPWERKATSLLRTLREIRSLRTCRINYVSTRGQADGERRFINRAEFVDCLKEAIGITNVALNPVTLQASIYEGGYLA